MIVDDDAVEDRIEVIHLDKLINRVFSKAHRGATRLSAEEETSLWEEVIDRLGVSLENRFLPVSGDMLSLP